ncbi:MAG: redoxin domain-containing protein [Anaerolineae bacterium]|nr:redoxin domain-containing protein [Anaerolineae bacterium]
MPALDADFERFQAEDTQVLGVSVDSWDTNAAWAASLGIEQVPLLSDFWPHGAVAQSYGVLREQGFTERATFIVDKEGIVRFIHIYDINEVPDNEELFEALQEIIP